MEDVKKIIQEEINNNRTSSRGQLWVSTPNMSSFYKFGERKSITTKQVAGLLECSKVYLHNISLCPQ